METFRKLSELNEGEQALILRVNAKNNDLLRLTGLGLTPNCAINCLFSSYFGDPKVFLIRNTIIALRKEDSDLIEVI